MSAAKILIIDDNEALVDGLRTYINSKYECHAVIFSRIGLEELRTGKYDLCLLDLNMPEISGFEILQEIKKNEKINTAFIIITGNQEIDSVVRAMRLGADDYVMKPFNFMEMELSIQKALETHYLKMENVKYRIHLEAEVEKKTRDVRRSYVDIIKAFASSIEMRDPYTAGHSGRVSDFATLLSDALGFSNRELEHVRIGCMLHDIGKIGVPDAVLRKKDLLTQNEYHLVQQHPEKGYNILKDIESIKYVIPYVRYHHEWYDGNGYPNGLVGDNIPLEGRILCLADSLDAMTSNRPYKTPLTPQQAYAEIKRCSGGQFDPRVVEVFKELWERNMIQPYLQKKDC